MDDNKKEIIEDNSSLPPNAEREPKEKLGFSGFFKKCFSPEFRIKTIAILIAVLVVAACIWGILSYMGPASVAERFVKAEFMENYVKLFKLSAYDAETYMIGDSSIEEYFEEISDDYDEDIQTWKDYSDYSVKSIKESLEDTFGDYKITYEVSRVKDISLKKLSSDYESFIEDLEEEGVFDFDEVTDSKIVNVKLKIKGEDETERMTYETALVKIGATWKVLDYDYDWD